jgi:hypothetical protein
MVAASLTANGFINTAYHIIHFMRNYFLRYV